MTRDGVFPREERLKYTEKAADQREHSAHISYLSAFQLKPFNLILSWDTHSVPHRMLDVAVERVPSAIRGWLLDVSLGAPASQRSAL